MTRAEQMRTAYATAWAAERAAAEGSSTRADAQAARLAAQEAQFYADLELTDAQAASRWLRRAYSAPPTWLAVADARQLAPADPDHEEQIKARHQQEAADWWESRGGMPKDVWAAEPADFREGQPSREAQEAAPGRLGEAVAHAEQARAAAEAGQPEVKASGRDPQAGEPAGRLPGRQGLAGERDPHGYDSEGHPGGTRHGPEAREHADAPVPGQFVAGDRNQARPSQPDRRSAYAAEDSYGRRQANPEADIEAGS
jgi:hypothetical protein